MLIRWPRIAVQFFTITPLALVASVALAQVPAGFATWVQALRVEALEKGISQETVDEALTGLVASNPRVVELDRNQPEFTLTLASYLSRVASDARVRMGKQKLAEHRELFDQVAERYGVQPRFIAAFWAVESDFGRVQGGFSVIQALATLAFDDRRSAFFRRQLFAALQIIDEGSISAGAMKGSWAGALGQPQFLPTVFLQSAVDFDGDGRRDIWNTTADVIASAANHLADLGWLGNQTWGREVILPDGFNRDLPDWKHQNPSATGKPWGCAAPTVAICRPGSCPRRLSCRRTAPIREPFWSTTITDPSCAGTVRTFSPSQLARLPTGLGMARALSNQMGSI